MYIDLIIFIVLLIVCLIRFKKFASYVYMFGIVDISFRIIYFIKTHIDVPFVNSILGYLHKSVAGLVEKYASGTLELVLLWIVVLLYIIFLSYIIKIFSKKRK